MGIFKSLLKEFWKKKFVIVLVIFQITFVITSLTNIYNDIKLKNYSKKQFEFLNVNPEKLYSSGGNLYSKKLLSYIEELENAVGENSVAVVDLTNMPFDNLGNNETFKALRRELTKGTFKEVYDDTLELFNVNYSAYNRMKIPLTSGEHLSKEDFKYNENMETSIIISDAYNSVFKIGDVINLSTKKFRIKGFFNRDFKWFGDDADNLGSMMLLPFYDKIIIPFNLYNGTDENKATFENEMFGNSILIFNENLSESKFKETIKSLNDKYKLDFVVKMAKENIDSFEKYNKEINLGINIRAIVVFFLSLLSLILIIGKGLDERKRELGIRMSCGASILYLKILILCEYLFYVLISTILALVSVYNYNKNLYVNESILIDLYMKDPIVTILFGLLISIVIIIISLVVLRKINNFNTSELIGGE